jgi:hypothetical protein
MHTTQSMRVGKLACNSSGRVVGLQCAHNSAATAAGVLTSTLHSRGLRCGAVLCGAVQCSAHDNEVGLGTPRGWISNELRDARLLVLWVVERLVVEHERSQLDEQTKQRRGTGPSLVPERIRSTHSQEERQWNETKKQKQKQKNKNRECWLSLTSSGNAVQSKRTNAKSRQPLLRFAVRWGPFWPRLATAGQKSQAHLGLASFSMKTLSFKLQSHARTRTAVGLWGCTHT